MNRAQIMIIFVVAFFVAAENDTTVPVSVNTATSPSFAGVTNTTAVNVTTVTAAPDPNTTVSTSSPVKTTTSESTATTTVIKPTTIGPTEAPTTTPITTVSNLTTVTTTTATSTASVEPMTTSDAPCVPSGFDGASFIGGIVLALGVIVILVIVVKCYNHQSRKNELHYSQF